MSITYKKKSTGVFYKYFRLSISWNSGPYLLQKPINILGHISSFWTSFLKNKCETLSKEWEFWFLNFITNNDHANSVISNNYGLRLRTYSA